jgi:type IV pilus assembly protein PilM
MKSWLSMLGKTRAAAPIGIDFAAQRLNVLQADAASGRPAVRAVASLAYPCERALLLANPKLLKTFVCEALAAAPFAGRRVISVLGPSEVRILPLTVHVQPGQSDAQAVGKAVHEQLGSAAAESVVDYYQVRSVEAAGPEKQVLAAVASTNTVLAYLEALRGAGLEPVALDIGPAAIARLLAAMQDDFEQSVLLINFGASKSYLTVIWGRRLMLDREIVFGELQLVERLSRALGLTAEVALALLREHGIGTPAGVVHQTGGVHPDIGRTVREILYLEFAALAEELVRTQVYVASRTRGSAISRVYLNGSVARYRHIQERVEELVRLPVELLDPFKAFHGAAPGTPAGSDTHAIALAAGLALRGCAHG